MYFREQCLQQLPSCSHVCSHSYRRVMITGSHTSRQTWPLTHANKFTTLSFFTHLSTHCYSQRVCIKSQMKCGGVRTPGRAAWPGFWNGSPEGGGVGLKNVWNEVLSAFFSRHIPLKIYFLCIITLCAQCSFSLKMLLQKMWITVAVTWMCAKIAQWLM